MAMGNSGKRFTFGIRAHMVRRPEKSAGYIRGDFAGSSDFDNKHSFGNFHNTRDNR